MLGCGSSFGTGTKIVIKNEPIKSFDLDSEVSSQILITKNTKDRDSIQSQGVYNQKDGVLKPKMNLWGENQDKYHIIENHSTMNSHTGFSFYHIENEKEESELMKCYTIRKSNIKEHVKFYRDFLYSIYLSHESILSPKNVYLKPQQTLIYENITGSTLDHMISMKHTENEGFENYEILEIIKYLTIAVNHCHEKGIVVSNLAPENIVFSKSEYISSLKLMNFNNAIIIDKKEEFQRYVNLDEVNGITKLEKALIINKYDQHNTQYYFENVNLLYKSPEYLFAKPYDYKLDVWSIGIILHTLIVNNLYALLLDKPVYQITKGNIKAIFGQKDCLKFKPLAFDSVEYQQVNDSFIELLQATLEVDPRKRCSSRKLLSMIKNIEKKELFFVPDS